MLRESKYIEKWFTHFDSLVNSFTNLKCVVISAIVFRGKYQKYDEYNCGPVLGITVDFTTNLLDHCMKQAEDNHVLWYEPIIWIKPSNSESLADCFCKIKLIISRFKISSYKSDQFSVYGMPYICYEYSSEIMSGLLNFLIDHKCDVYSYPTKHLFKRMSDDENDYIDYFKQQSGYHNLHVLSDAKIHSFSLTQINDLIKKR
jgi:hypothetical protein